MQTANRNHANRPTIATPSDRARMAARIPSPYAAGHSIANTGILLASLAAILAVIL